MSTDSIVLYAVYAGEYDTRRLIGLYPSRALADEAVIIIRAALAQQAKGLRCDCPDYWWGDPAVVNMSVSTTMPKFSPLVVQNLSGDLIEFS